MSPTPSKPSKALTIWAVSLVVLIITYGLVLFPKQQKMRHLKQETAASQRAIEALQQLTSPKARATLQEHQDQLETQVRRLVFNEEELSRFDFKVREMASQSHLTHFNSRNRFKESQPASPGQGQLRRQQISMSAQCDFMGFLQFINELERHEPAAFITQFQLNHNYENNKQPQTVATLDVSIYSD